MNNAKFALDAFAKKMTGAEYYEDVLDMSPGSHTFKQDSTNLDHDIAEISRYRDYVVAESSQHGWAKVACDSKIDAELLLASNGFLPANAEDWKRQIACTTLGKMIEAEQASREAANARGADEMDATTMSTAAA